MQREVWDRAVTGLLLLPVEERSRVRHADASMLLRGGDTDNTGAPRAGAT